VLSAQGVLNHIEKDNLKPQNPAKNNPEPDLSDAAAVALVTNIA